MPVHHFNHRATGLDQASFEGAIHGQRGRLSFRRQGHDEIVRVLMFSGMVDDRCTLVQQAEQQATPFPVEGFEFFPDPDGHQPCGTTNQGEQGVVQVDLRINRRSPTAGVNDEIHVLASDDRCVADEAPAGSGPPGEGYALTDVRTDGQTEL